MDLTDAWSPHLDPWALSKPIGGLQASGLPMNCPVAKVTATATAPSAS